MFLLALLAAHYVNAPVVEMREKATNQSEIVSDAYYGERVEALDEAGDWVKIQTSIDGYEGWVKKAALFQPQNELFAKGVQTAKVVRPTAHLYDQKDTVYGPILTLPFESRLEVVDAGDKRWIEVKTVDGKKGFIQRGCVSFDAKSLTIPEMLSLSQEFMYLPYTWGGRSSFGYDCSGFTQMLYRQMNILLPRDSKQQINYQGFTATTKEELKPGDLIFWGLSDDKIRHVGIYLGNEQFIHASARENKPWIRISHLSDQEWDGSGTGDAKYAYRTFRTLQK